MEKLAMLSRLKFDDQKIESFSKEFNNILGFVDSIGEVDTTGISPLTSVANLPSTPEREDVALPPSAERRDAHQKNAPKAEMGFFSVPRIVE
ncbi:MAG: Asp-tRNA(Asn)/Glu-tRNA(Gln) amidotransferase GatCAB subunit C [Alphaproteobacteria bacterium CG_4_10_14_0_8_um_filter_53_9]|nr:MAG: Asp-tRNA(Asn)/Glu-tRNA(Gln) amidotransferase GatCAB subunit C [Alphaproteobacteria bacterium CG_4_10_14_0_8_um_filter_53_9]